MDLIFHISFIIISMILLHIETGGNAALKCFLNNALVIKMY